MTPRSKRYFLWKERWETNAPLADMTRMFDKAIVADIIAAAKPIGKKIIPGPSAFP